MTMRLLLNFAGGKIKNRYRSGPKGLRADIGSLKGFKEERDVDS
jgi:hypothetical protein